jgi:hypothetical protein
LLLLPATALGRLKTATGGTLAAALLLSTYRLVGGLHSAQRTAKHSAQSGQ